MYGARDAAQSWELGYIKMLVEPGFAQGSCSACVFYHSEKNMRAVARGDDFTVFGSRAELDWFREVIQRRMEVKFKSRLQRRRPGTVRILNRIVTAANGGLEYEADQMHAEMLMKDVGLDEESRGVNAPVSNGEGGQFVKGGKSESKFRALVATGNYEGPDKMEIPVAAKEFSRFTPKPEDQGWTATKRLVTYFKDHRRVVLEYKHQELPKKVVVRPDSDFERCGRTRKS